MLPVCCKELALFTAEVCCALLASDPVALTKFIDKRPSLLTNVLFPFCNDTSSDEPGRKITAGAEKLVAHISKYGMATTVEGLTEWTLQVLSICVMKAEKYTAKAKAVLKLLDSLLKTTKQEVLERLHNLILSLPRYDSCAREIFDLAWAEILKCDRDPKYMRDSKFHPLKVLGAMLCIADVKSEPTAGDGNTVSHTAKLPITVDHVTGHIKALVATVNSSYTNKYAKKMIERLLVVCSYMVRLCQPFREKFVAELVATVQGDFPPTVLCLLGVLENGDGKVSFAGALSLMMYSITRGDRDSSKLREWLLKAGLVNSILRILDPAKAPKPEEKQFHEFKKERTCVLVANLFTIPSNQTFMDAQDPLVLESIQRLKASPFFRSK